MAQAERDGGLEASMGAGAAALVAPMLELVEAAQQGESRRATIVVPRVVPARRLFSADEKAVLFDFIRGALAVVAFSIAASSLLVEADASTALRAAAGLSGAAVLGTLVLLLVRREGEHPLDWAARVSLCAGVAAWALLVVGHRLHVHGLSLPRGRFFLLLAITFFAAALGGAIARRLHLGIRRRVLLIDNARIDEAVLATGTSAMELYGPIAATDEDALLRMGDAGIDDAVIGQPMRRDDVLAISNRMRDAWVRLHAIETPASDGDSPVIGAFPTRFSTFRRSAMTPAWAFAKRLFDVAAGSLAVLVLSPVFLAAAIAVKLSSPGPVFFGQTRTGLRGSFRALKFRTMRPGAHLAHEQLIAQHGNMFKLRRDPRVTSVGRWLRRFSIDELPQLFQVITGEMSLVGPRPPMPEEVSRYTASQLRRLGVRPGCTGLWQVSGRSDLPFDKWVELDAHYIEKWSPLLELKILAKTASAVLGGKGAY